MKSSPTPLRSVRGAAALTIIIIVVLLAAAAGGAWWYFTQNQATAPKVGTPTTATSQSSGAVSAEEAEARAAAAAAAAVEGLSIDQLYREARTAMAEERLVAPAGNNALAFYLAILEKDATNSGAADALRELFPFASGTAEQEINQGNLEEADRIIASLAKADPSNYTLTILRSKLDAKRKQIEQQATEAAAAAAAAAAPARPAVETAAEAAEAEAIATAAAAAAAPKPAPTPAPVKATPPPAPVVAAPQGENRDVEILQGSPPTYPRDAVRDRAEGWVEVEFTVLANGKVTDAKVTASNPSRTFDREAIRSIERTKFSPRLENGVAVSATVRRRIEFKLSR